MCILCFTHQLFVQLLLFDVQRHFDIIPIIGGRCVGWSGRCIRRIAGITYNWIGYSLHVFAPIFSILYTFVVVFSVRVEQFDGYAAINFILFGAIDGQSGQVEKNIY